MGTRNIALACASVLMVARLVSAQVPDAEAMTALQTAVACASPPVVSPEPADALRVVGSQDVVDRSLFGSPEVLVLSGGTNREVKVNTVYFVRRILRSAETIKDKLAHSVQTAGWVRVVSVNEKMALVSPVHTCTDIRTGDYLEPFMAPVVMESAVMPPLVQGELDFDEYSRVLHGELGRRSMGSNEFATIDHGVDRNIRVGTRFAVYRDLKLSQNPLKRIGEAIAMSVGPSMTLVRITSARDAVFTGDVMVPRAIDGVKSEPAASAEAAVKGDGPSQPSGCQSGARVPPQNPRCGG
jgi:hypothetical protein